MPSHARAHKRTSRCKPTRRTNGQQFYDYARVPRQAGAKHAQQACERNNRALADTLLYIHAGNSHMITLAHAPYVCVQCAGASVVRLLLNALALFFSVVVWMCVPLLQSITYSKVYSAVHSFRHTSLHICEPVHAKRKTGFQYAAPAAVKRSSSVFGWRELNGTRHCAKCTCKARVCVCVHV